jgi:hypothetical protein
MLYVWTSTRRMDNLEVFMKIYSEKTTEFTEKLDEVAEAYEYSKNQKYKKMWLEMLDKWYKENQIRFIFRR